MPKANLRLSTPKWYDLYQTCHSHGWIHLAPFRWETTGHQLYLVMSDGKTAFDLYVKQSRQREIQAHIVSHRPVTAEQRKFINQALRRSLSLDVDTEPLHRLSRRLNPLLARWIKSGAGRLLKGVSCWEDAAKTLFTTNCSWRLTEKMADAACAMQSLVSPEGCHPFPAAAALAGKRTATLQKSIPCGYRAVYLKALAVRFKKAGEHGSDTLTKDQVRQWPGFGDYAASHLMLLLDHYDHIPIDSVERGFLGAANDREAAAIVQQRYAAWGDYRWWALKLEKIAGHRNWIGG